MPGGNGTGPNGSGPMTGRAAGFCAGSNVGGYANAGGARAYGMGRGRGRAGTRACGFGRGFARAGAYQANAFLGANIAPDQEMDALKQQASALQSSLSQINDRISQLENKE